MNWQDRIIIDHARTSEDAGKRVKRILWSTVGFVVAVPLVILIYVAWVTGGLLLQDVADYVFLVLAGVWLAFNAAKWICAGFVWLWRRTSHL